MTHNHPNHPHFIHLVLPFALS